MFFLKLYIYIYIYITYMFLYIYIYIVIYLYISFCIDLCKDTFLPVDLVIGSDGGKEPEWNEPQLEDFKPVETRAEFFIPQPKPRFE